MHTSQPMHTGCKSRNLAPANVHPPFLPRFSKTKTNLPPPQHTSNTAIFLPRLFSARSRPFTYKHHALFAAHSQTSPLNPQSPTHTKSPVYPHHAAKSVPNAAHAHAPNPSRPESPQYLPPAHRPPHSIPCSSPVPDKHQH